MLPPEAFPLPVAPLEWLPVPEDTCKLPQAPTNKIKNLRSKRNLAIHRSAWNLC